MAKFQEQWPGWLKVTLAYFSMAKHKKKKKTFYEIQNQES